MRVPAVRYSRNREAFKAATRKWHAHPRALVEGDSWFEYDAAIAVNPSPSNLFLGLCEYFQCIALLLSHSGDTVMNMLGPYPDFTQPGAPIASHWKGDRNLKRLREYLNRQNGIQLLFFSGGGNDVVDNLQHLVHPYRAGMRANEALNEPNVQAQMAALHEGYRRLIATRDAVSPETWILTHQYGIPNLTKGGFRRFGYTWTKEWIKDPFRALGYISPNEKPSDAQLQLMTSIIDALMRRFAQLLAHLSADPKVRKFFVADTIPRLGAEHWRDEMHLTKAGFRAAATAFRPQLEGLFPSWTV